MRYKFRVLLPFATLCIFFAWMPFSNATAMAEPSPPNGSFPVQITEVSSVIGENYVRYPKLEGMDNEAVQQSVNNAIVEEALIIQRLATLAGLQPEGPGLQVSYEAYVHEYLFSTVISAKGVMETQRSGHRYTALSYDLRTGEKLRLQDLFSDPASAVAWMETQLTGAYQDELSLFLEFSDVTPLPVDSFTMNADGLTFWYPFRQFSLLSGYSGAVQFQYGELQDYLRKDAESIPVVMGAILPPLTDADIKTAIEAAAAAGMLPYVPARLGDSIADRIAADRLARVPDQYPGGRYFQLEAPAYRQILLLSDALTEDYTHSVVEGILATRMNLFGLQTGVSARKDWLRILGQPEKSVVLDAEIATDYGFVPGTADYYTVSNRQLMLYADTSDILYAVRLMK